MGNNFQINVYQFNQSPGMAGQTCQRIGLPTAQVFLFDCTNSPTRSLPTGYNVYCLIKDIMGNEYYVIETIATVAALVG